MANEKNKSPIAYDTVDFYDVKSIHQYFDSKNTLISKIREAQNDWEDWQRKANIDLDPGEPQNPWETPPLLDFIDLLIVDEAGQVSPEIGAATLLWRKRLC